MNIEQELIDYSQRLTQVQGEIRDTQTQLQQLINNANAISGVVQFLTMKLNQAKDTGPGVANGGNTDQHDSDKSAEPDGGGNSPILE